MASARSDLNIRLEIIRNSYPEVINEELDWSNYSLTDLHLFYQNAVKQVYEVHKIREETQKRNIITLMKTLVDRAPDAETKNSILAVIEEYEKDNPDTAKILSEINKWKQTALSIEPMIAPLFGMLI